MNKEKELDLDFEHYSQLFLSKIPLAKKVNKHTFAGRCVVCGDSRVNSRKTRLYLMRERGKYPNCVICHNCHISTSAKSFFTQYFPNDMAELQKGFSERDLTALAELRAKREEEKKKDPKSKLSEEDQYLLSFGEELKRAKEKVNIFFERFTEPVNNNPEAISYMKSRNVPDYYTQTMRLLKHYGEDGTDYHNQKIFRYAYLRDYILIPFIDYEDEKKYYFHARRYRNLNYTMAKYLACPYNPDDVEVSFFYNELNVSTDEHPVIICEGTISSMHLPNSISTNGVGKQTEEFVRKMEWKFGGASNIIYANDNELVDRDALDKAKELLAMGKRVFLWSLMGKDNPAVNSIKDFNDLCVRANKKEIPFSTIERYTANSPVALLRGN